MIKLFSFRPVYNTFDYERVLENRVKHISEILSNIIDNGIEFYILLEVYMKRSYEESPTPVTFETKSSNISRRSDIEVEIRKHNNQIVTFIEDYLKGDFVWMIEIDKMVYLLVIEYQ